MLSCLRFEPFDAGAFGYDDELAAQRKNLEHCLGLDQSMPKQFVSFLGNVVDGSLGHQCPDPKGKPTVAARIMEVFPHTLANGIFTLIASGLPAGTRIGALNPQLYAAFKAKGYAAVRFGPRVLRTETAPLAAVAAMQVLWGDC